jgi:hypothetical protein
MGLHHRKEADKKLKADISKSLPWRWKWAGYVYYLAVWRYGGFLAYDSCGYLFGKKVCRHNIQAPYWMLKHE